MRRMTALVFVLFVAAGARAANDKPIHKTAELNANGRVSISTHNGSISVKTWNRSTVDVQATVEAVFDTNQEDVNATDVKISGSGSSVTIETDYSGVQGWFGRNLGVNWGNVTLPPVHYTVTVPATAVLRVSTHNASVKAQGLRSDVEIETHNGEIEVADIDGGVRLESHNGGIHASFARLARNSLISTHNGSIDVRMPQSAAFHVDADGHHLDFESDFPATTHRYESSRFEGDINGGGPELHITTHNGSVRLRKS